MATTVRTMMRTREDPNSLGKTVPYGLPTVKDNFKVKELLKQWDYNPVDDINQFQSDWEGHNNFKIGNPCMSAKLDELDKPFTEQRLEHFKLASINDKAPHKGVTYGRKNLFGCNSGSNAHDLVSNRFGKEFNYKMEKKQQDTKITAKKRNSIIYSKSHDKSVNTKHNFAIENIDSTQNLASHIPPTKIFLNKQYYDRKIQALRSVRQGREGICGEQDRIDYERAIQSLSRNKKPNRLSNTCSYPNNVGNIEFSPDPANVARKYKPPAYSGDQRQR